MNTRKAMMPYLNECGIVCPLGATHSEIKARLFERAESGVLPVSYTHLTLPTNREV